MDILTTPGDQPVATWAYTRIVRKEGSQPSSPNDGVLVLDSAVRNQYQSEPYWDSGLENGVTYYYAAYAFTTEGLVSDPVFAFATPKTYAPLLRDNTWEEINRAVEEGLASELWQKGDTKPIELTDGKAMEVSIVEFNPSNRYSISDGSGYPGIVFASKNLYYTQTSFLSGYNFGASDRSEIGFFYANMYNLGQKTPEIKTNFDAVYSLFPESLKKYVKTVNLTYDAKKGIAPSTNPKYGSGTSQVFPVETDLVEVYFPTASDRIKKLNNGEGAAAPWYTGDMGIARESTGSRDEFAARYVDENGTVVPLPSKYPEGIDYPRIGQTMGICFAFCLGTQPKA